MIRPQPSNLWVFIDENPDSVNDAAYAVAMAQSLWQDGPSTYHGGGCGFSFADGHSEIKKWQDGRTMPALKKGAELALNVSSPNNRDVFWLMERTTRKVK